MKFTYALIELGNSCISGVKKQFVGLRHVEAVQRKPLGAYSARSLVHTKAAGLEIKHAHRFLSTEEASKAFPVGNATRQNRRLGWLRVALRYLTQSYSRFSVCKASSLLVNVRHLTKARSSMFGRTPLITSGQLREHRASSQGQSQCR